VLGPQRGNQCARRAKRDDLSIVHHCHAIAEPRRFLM
jgi:hypothetical protein